MRYEKRKTDFSTITACGLCSGFPCDNISKLIYWNPDVIEHMKALREDYIENL